MNGSLRLRDFPGDTVCLVCDKCGTLQNLLVRYNEVLRAQAQVTAACNALHSVEAR